MQRPAGRPGASRTFQTSIWSANVTDSGSKAAAAGRAAMTVLRVSWKASRRFIKPAAGSHPGDMTDAGIAPEWAQFLDAVELHPALAERMLILPGNHDLN